MSQANGLRVSGEPMEAPSLAEALLCRFLRRPKQPLNNTPLTWLKARLMADSLIKAYQYCIPTMTDEGLELNVLGLNIGIDAAVPALKLPAIGRLGLDR
jgi:hypothetical protein